MAEIKESILLDENLKKEYEIIIDFNFINLRIDEEVLKRQKTYRLDGFRIGKVPVEIIKQKEENALFFGVAENLINKEVFDLADRNKFDLSGEPKVEIKTMELNKDVVFTVKYILLPKIDEIDLSKINLDSYEVELQDSDIDNAISEILKNFKNWVKKDDVAVLGDAVKIDFLGKINNEPFDGGKGEDYQLELGSHSFIDTFEEQLVDKKTGDKLIVKVRFPDDYQSSKLAGKNADFEVKIKEVLKSDKIELTDEFIMKNFGIETIEKLKEVVKKELEESYKMSSKNKIINIIYEELVKLATFEIPQDMVDEQYQILLKNKQNENLKDKKEEKIDEKEIAEEAEKSIKLGLLLSHIGKKQNITVTENEINSAIMKNAMQMKGYEKVFIDFYKKNPEAVRRLQSEILENKVVDYIFNNITRNIIKLTSEEFKNIK